MSRHMCPGCPDTSHQCARVDSNHHLFTQDKALNLIGTPLMRTATSRSSTLRAAQDASDVSGGATFVRVLSRAAAGSNRSRGARESAQSACLRVLRGARCAAQRSSSVRALGRCAVRAAESIRAIVTRPSVRGRLRRGSSNRLIRARSAARWSSCSRACARAIARLGLIMQPLSRKAAAVIRHLV
jgi:hypothetical protein